MMHSGITVTHHYTHPTYLEVVVVVGGTCKVVEHNTVDSMVLEQPQEVALMDDTALEVVVAVQVEE